jgi:hypothetical protein
LPPKVPVAERFSIFDGQVIAAESQSIFTGDTKPPKIILFLMKTTESNLYFRQPKYRQK